MAQFYVQGRAVRPKRRLQVAFHRGLEVCEYQQQRSEIPVTYSYAMSFSVSKGHELE